MKIGGLQKFSLIDYPGEICAIIFTIGCNFRCPYCHNPELVTGSAREINTDYILNFLKARKGKLSAVSITGGEPTLQGDLPDFIRKIKLVGYKNIKLDTNGTNPDMLKTLIDEKLINYIAIDIKAPFEKYEMVIKNRFKMENVLKSINLLRGGSIEYEFRTTVVKDLISKEDILKIAETIRGSRAYYLQRFISSKTLDENFLEASSFKDEELDKIRVSIEHYFDRLLIR